MPSHRQLLLLLLLPCLLAARCAPEQRLTPSATRQLAKKIELLPNLKRIEIQFHDGLLTLEPGNTLDCEVLIDLQANNDQAVEQLTRNIAVKTERLSAGASRLSVPLPAGQPMGAVRTTWRLTIPPGIDIVAKTRRGSIESRNAPGDLTVEGGTGRVNARMAGGHADLTTTSGELLLRGDYTSAQLRSRLGRIVVELPASASADALDLQLDNELGTTYLNLQDKQWFQFFFKGELQDLLFDPTVRVAWEPRNPNRDLLQGQIGDLQDGASCGQIRLSTEHAAHIRMRRQTSAPTKQPTDPGAAR